LDHHASGVKGVVRSHATTVAMRLLLVGCSSDANIYHSFVGQRVVGNTNYVSVSNVWNEMDGSPLAEKHCAQYGKAARFTHMEAHMAIYDCVSH